MTRSGAAGLAVLALGTLQARRAPTGFLDVSMSWSLTENTSPDGLGTSVEDEGYCSARLEFKAAGVVHAVHGYDRTVTKRFPEQSGGRTVTLVSYINSIRVPFTGAYDPGPSVFEYQGNPSLVAHRDGSYSLTLRRQFNPIFTRLTEETWRYDPAGKVLDHKPPAARDFHVVCDPIAEYQRAKARQRLGFLSGLTGSDSVLNSHTRGGMLVDLRASWDLRP